MPKPFVRVSGQLVFAGKTLERLTFPDRVVTLYVIDDCRGQNEKTSVDPTIPLWFLLKTNHPVSLGRQRTKARRRSHGGHRCEYVLSPVKFEESSHVDIGKTVAVGKKEFFVIQELAHALQPPAGHGFGTCVDKRHLPWLSSTLMNLHLVFCHVEGDI